MSRRVLAELVAPARAADLGRRGLREVRDLLVGSPDDADLAAELAAARESSRTAPVSALEILDRRSLDAPDEIGAVITFCRRLDVALGGGARRGKLLELVGPPGSGKTQCVLQLAVDATIPRAFRGCGGRAVLIDCDGSASPTRLRSLATAMVDHVKRVAAKHPHDTAKRDAANSLSVDRTCANIDVIRAFDDLDLLAALEALLDEKEDEPPLRLVAVDSVATPFRWLPPDADPDERPRLIARVGRDLARLADTRACAVVVANQVTMTTTTTPADAGAAFEEVPALGLAWSHVADARVHLRGPDPSLTTAPSGRDGTWVAVVAKGAAAGARPIEFCVDHRGLRDCSSTRSHSHNKGPP